MGEKSWYNIRAIKYVLLLFELAYGLKVNFNKSLFVGISVNEPWLEEVAKVLRCRVGHTSFNYLGMSIVDNPRHMDF